MLSCCVEVELCDGCLDYRRLQTDARSNCCSVSACHEHETPWPSQDVAIELSSPVISVSINARRPEAAAVGLEAGPPVLVTFADRSVRQLPTVDLGARCWKTAALPHDSPAIFVLSVSGPCC